MDKKSRPNLWLGRVVLCSGAITPRRTRLRRGDQATEAVGDCLTARAVDARGVEPLDFLGLCPVDYLSIMGDMLPARDATWNVLLMQRDNTGDTGHG